MFPLDHLIGRPRGGAAKRRPPYFRTKKLGLLGSTDSLRFAPWSDPSWTFAAHPCCRPRCEREPDWYFDLHRPECFRRERKPWNQTYHTWLTRLQTPIFMQEHWPEIPMAVRYPLEQVEAEYPTFTGVLFATNHCAYMIALAMMEGVETVGLFGCQYAGGERGTQRESLLYWMGRFEQAGGRLVVPRKYNTLMTMPLYGYASHDAEGALLEVYRPALAVATPTGPQDLFPLDERPLMRSPRHEAPNWDRAKALYGLDRPAVRREADHTDRAAVDVPRATGAIHTPRTRRVAQDPAPELVEA